MTEFFISDTHFNHDHQKLKKALEADEDLKERTEWHDIGVLLKREKKLLHLTHYPLIMGDRANRINLHGHIHDMAYQEPNVLNVGVDSPELGDRPFGVPLSLAKCLALVEKKQENFNQSDKVYTKHGTIE